MASSLIDTVGQHGLGLITQVVQGLVGQAADLLIDDDRYRRSVIDPTWDMMPLPLRLIGRSRLRWDDLFFELRNEVLEVRGAEIALRSDATTRITRIAYSFLGDCPKRTEKDDRKAEEVTNPMDQSRSPVSSTPATRTPPPTTPRVAVGIDLGTTLSVIAHLDSAGRPWTITNAEGDVITPSVVLFDGDKIIVGKEAIKAAALEPERVAQFAKRDMGSPVYSRSIQGEHLPPEVIQSLILEKLKRDAEAKLGPIREVVITVPAYFNEPRRKATQDAGQLAGLEVLDIINEPTAAAIAYGVQNGFLTPKGESRQAETILVYDLGGGTFDVTLMRIDGREYRTLATAGDVYLGGIDWDGRIVDHIAEVFRASHHGIDPKDNPAGLQRLQREAEEAKRALTARDLIMISFEHAGQGVRVPLSRSQFESMTADLLDRTRFTTTNLLREAGFDPAGLSRLLLVGGSTRMPMVGAMLELELGLRPDRTLSVDEAVAHGAAIYAGLLLASEPSLGGMSVRNVNSHGLGVLGIEPATGRKRNTVLIPRNTPLPTTKTGRFQTRREDQSSVAVQVIEGGDASGNGATPIGRCIVRDLPPGLPAGTPVLVTFSYSENGRLAIEARLPGIEREAVLTLDRASGLSEEKLATWQRRIQAGLRPLGLDG